MRTDLKGNVDGLQSVLGWWSGLVVLSQRYLMHPSNGKGTWIVMGWLAGLLGGLRVGGHPVSTAAGCCGNGRDWNVTVVTCLVGNVNNASKPSK
jgi:hypothetical protein